MAAAAHPRVYWVSTLLIALPALAAGVLDVAHAPPLFTELLHLGYPAYFSSLLGTWKILGAIVLLAPHLPRVKEWAYAGMFFDYSAAVISHLACHDSLSAAVGPFFSIAVLWVSWWTRPAGRHRGC